MKDGEAVTFEAEGVNYRFVKRARGIYIRHVLKNGAYVKDGAVTIKGRPTQKALLAALKESTYTYVTSPRLAEILWGG